MSLTLPDQLTVQKVLLHELCGAANIKMVVVDRGCAGRHGRAKRAGSCLSTEIGQM